MNILLTIAAVILICTDVITTLLAIKHGAYEANPIMAKLFSAAGIVPILLITHGAVIAALIYYNSLIVSGVVAAVYLVVFINNMRVLSKLK